MRGTVRSLGNAERTAHLTALGKALPGACFQFLVRCLPDCFKVVLVTDCGTTLRRDLGAA